MAKVKVRLDGVLMDGQNVTFKAPCACSEIDGLTVSYLTRENSQYVENSVDFTFRDAHSNDLTHLGNLFDEGAYVKVVLDTTNHYAFIQNADTNAYLEGKFVDYIVEEDVEGAETYRKWDSGVAEYWGAINFSIPVANWAAWGSLYYAKCDSEAAGHAYPSGLFVSDTIIHNLSIASLDGNCWGVVAQNTASKSRPPSAYVFSAVKPSKVVSVGIGIYSKGRWK